MLLSGKAGRRGRHAAGPAPYGSTGIAEVRRARAIRHAHDARTELVEGARAAAGGFTLIELLVVMAIILALAGIITSAAFAFKKTMLKRAAIVDIQAFTMGLAVYKRDLGTYPPADIILAAGFHEGDEENGMNEVLHYYLGRKLQKGANFYGPYVKFKGKRLRDDDGDDFMEYRDPWGTFYLYAVNPTGGYDIVSPGPDGELGGTITVAGGYVLPASDADKKAGKDDVTQRSK